MRRNNRIVISIVGIIIVALMLLGLTYGYYVTRIFGNENSKSIEIVTGLTEITYSDLSEEVTDEIITPGYETTKLFTIENTGNVEAKYSIYMVDVVNTFSRTQDITYTLYRKSGNNTIDFNDLSDCEVITTGTFPTEIAVIKANETLAPKSESDTTNTFYTYLLKIVYVNSYENQNIDQGKTFGGKINIRATETETNPFSEGSLVYNIYNNAINVTDEQKTLGYAVFTEPEDLPTTPAESVSGPSESVISTATDDYGTSYYFRGNVQNNYVNFAGMCWRIVRIEGNGSTKLILEDYFTTCDDTETTNTDLVYTGNWSVGVGNYGYDSTQSASSGGALYKMNYLNPVTNNTSSMVKAFYDFQTTKLADYTGKLKSGDWCLGDKAYTRSGSSGSYTYTLLEDTSSNYLSKTSFYYDAYTRLTSGNANGYQPTLKCNGTILNEFADVSGVSSKAPMYVSAITADEIVYAGGKYEEANGNYYLLNNYQKSNYSYFWVLSPYYFTGNTEFAFYVDIDGDLDFNYVFHFNDSFRPSVSLKSSVSVTKGVGTISNPYVIE